MRDRLFRNGDESDSVAFEFFAGFRVNDGATAESDNA